MVKATEPQFTFIDLFAGLGGFHIALKQLGGKCVFASELRKDLRDLYAVNFPGVILNNDITEEGLVPKIPKHDVLCAGFPCQPFSQAGKRQGFDDDKDRGNLFWYIKDILKEHKPTYFILENVSNLKGHDDTKTWKIIKYNLEHIEDQESGKEFGYTVKEAILSPHQFGLPQHRKRIYIVGKIRNDSNDNSLDYFDFPEPTNELCDIKTIIHEDDEDIQPLKIDTIHQLKIWQEFLDLTVANDTNGIPKFPIWAMEFGANYDYRDCAPAFRYKTLDDFSGIRGNLGKYVLRGYNCKNVKECMSKLPIYAQTDKSYTFPLWKIKYIEQNREFGLRNAAWLKDWKKKIDKFNNSHIKFEWNCSPDNHDYLIKDCVVQFRASGIRVKDANFVPALNLVGTQIPILPWVKLPPKFWDRYDQSMLDKYNLTKEDLKYGRYLSVKEAAELQGFNVDGDFYFGNLSKTRIFQALGNAVNTDVVKIIAEKLLKS